MFETPNVTWIEAALVETGMRQTSFVGPREIASVVDAGGERVIVSYTDGSSHAWYRHEELSILADEPNGAQ